MRLVQIFLVGGMGVNFSLSIIYSVKWESTGMTYIHQLTNIVSVGNILNFP
jgi:hypothetical protein